MPITLKKLKALPDSPGVYFFRGARKKILYIGKATSLRSRVRSYFNEDIVRSRGPLIVKMLEQAISVDTIATDSVLEALILEANLIKKHQPDFNTKEKDNKSFNYVVITDEPYPRVLLVRGRDLQVAVADQKLLKGKRSMLRDLKPKHVFGPFPQGAMLQVALKIVRKIFPFRDKCTPFTPLSASPLHASRPCFNAQIGLCPGVCSGTMSEKEYRNQIKNIVLFFEGKKNVLVRKLEKEMKEHAKSQEFEKAAKVKKTIFALRHIQDVALLKNHSDNRAQKNEFRIEAYDIAHLSGSNTVGVMTVVLDGELDKDSYRKFKLRGAAHNTVNDIANLKEIVSRRLAHPEWQYPNLIVVDGSVPQRNAVEEILKKHSVSVPVVAVVKDERHSAKEVLGDAEIIEVHKNAILLANSEAHRFAIGYHRTLRGRLDRR